MYFESSCRESTRVVDTRSDELRLLSWSGPTGDDPASYMAPIDELLDVLHKEASQSRSEERLHDAIALLNNIRRPQTAAATSHESASPAEEQFAHLLLQLLDEGALEAPQKVKEIAEKLGEEFSFLRSALSHHIPSKSRNTLSNEAHPGDIEEELQSKVSIVMPPPPSKDFPSLPWRDDSGRFNDLNDIYFLHTLANSPEMLISTWQVVAVCVIWITSRCRTWGCFGRIWFIFAKFPTESGGNCEAGFLGRGV